MATVDIPGTFSQLEKWGFKTKNIYDTSGKASSGRQTQHINICCFFVKDRVASGEVKIEHCPKEMVADFFTKPLQGSQFIKLKDGIMNANPRCLDYSLEDCRSVLNIAATNGGQTECTGTDTGWIIVESKKAKQAKRIMSRMNDAKTRNDHDGNGEAKGKRVRFVVE